MRLSIVFATLFFFAAASPTAAQTYNDITVVSKNAAGALADAVSSSPTVSGDGTLAAYASAAINLAAGASDGSAADIFLVTRASGAVTLVSKSSGGGTANGASSNPRISTDGAFVVFESSASNIAAGDGNGAADVFEYKVADGSTTLVSTAVGGGTGNGASLHASVSANGRYVAFESAASNLINSDTNAVSDIFVYDTVGATMERVSVDGSGTQANGASSYPVISADGRYVAFQSAATNLVTDDTNTVSDIFIRDRTGGTTARLSVSAASVQGNGASSRPSMSADGRYVAFVSAATNLAATPPDTNSADDVFFVDTAAPGAALVSAPASGAVANGKSAAPFVSADGAKIAFLSDADNLVDDDSNNTAGDGNYDVFVYTRAGATVVRKSVNFYKVDKAGTSSAVALSSDGAVALFDSTALLAEPSDGSQQVFATDDHCTADSDADSTVNCSDACPADAAKIAVGVCGCGSADTDTDGDGTADCIDACPADSGKIARGSCGCGVADTDANGNGVADCLDPTALSVPTEAILILKGSTLTVRIPTKYTKVLYEVRVTKSNRAIASRSSRANVLRFTLHAGTGRYSVRYRVSLGGVSSKFSKSVSINLK